MTITATKLRTWPFHTQDEVDAVANVLSSGRTNYWTGEECRQFEKEYAAFFGAEYAISVMNGTVALEAALSALEIGPNDEVITTCRTFIASASCIVKQGAIPVIADIDMESQNITAETILPCITPRTKAIIVVHLAGWPADMPNILKLAKQHQLKVIEDCAQAHGARLHDQYVGTFGDISAFSFCQDKIITTGGEGGMILTNQSHLWNKMWSYKDHGKNYSKVYHTEHPFGFRWLHDDFGTNARMTEMQSAIGRLQLKKLINWLEIRNNHARIYTKHLQNLSCVRIPIPEKHITHAYYKYYFFIRPDKLKPQWNRDRILKEACLNDIPCYTGSCSEIYLEEAFSKNHLQPPSRKPNAKVLGETSLMLPVDPSFSESRINELATQLVSILQRASL